MTEYDPPPIKRRPGGTPLTDALVKYLATAITVGLIGFGFWLGNKTTKSPAPARAPAADQG